ncbi:MAG: SusC/RagA family TonB-linked outer membrane protein [Chitinophagales bacterium]|nr:SusC/RagA family TonB-linked outer membrane protein [Chitinophagales bacterium]
MKRLFYKLAITLLAIPAFCNAVFAQFDVNGTVTSSAGEPLIGVTVSVKNTNNGTVTNEDGYYNIRISGSSATLVFSYLGYRSQEKPVSSSGTVNVALEEANTELDEVIVSGLATSVKRANSANAVAAISAKQLTGITQQSTLDGAIYGKFTGAQITQSSGAPGGGIGIRMRGITSINGPAQPLFIVDGIFVDNSSIAAGLNLVSNAAGGGNAAQFDQDNASNRIADIDPGDIESIEILKGAAAAAIYGSTASSGVVIITTKRGKQSKKDHANVEFSQSLGFQTMLNPQGTRSWDSEKVAGSFGEGEVPNFQAAESSGTLHDYENELYGNKGMLSDTRLSFANANDKTSFYSSISHKSEDGIVEKTGYTKTSVRLNLNHKVSERFDLAVSTNYVKSSADRGYFNNDNTSTTMGISFAGTPSWAQLQPDAEGNYPDNPYSAANFLQTRDLITNNEAVDRFLGGMNLVTKIVTNDRHSLKLILNGGLDAYTFQTTAIFPKELQFEKNGNGTNGASIQGTTTNFNNNESAFLVYSFFPASAGFNIRAQGGLTRESFERNTMIASATQLIGAQTNVSQAGAVDMYQFRSKQLNLGGFGQVEVDFDGKVILTAGLRGDKSSNNGDENKVYYYPKASAAVNLAEFAFWNMEDWNQFKLRVAYGQSGNFATFGSAFTSLGSTIIEGAAGSLINTTQGNNEVGPERQSELEFGTDLGFLDNRISAEITYYIKNVTDLLLVSLVPSSTGFVNKVTNAAELRNKGLEVGLGIDIIRKKDFEWFNQTNFWFNKSEITQLDIPSYAVGSFGATLGTFYIEQGASATQIVGIGTAADGEDTTDNGLVVWGDSEPDFQISFGENLRYKNWELGLVLHWKQGGDNVNLTTLLTDIFGTSPDFDDIDLDPAGVTANGPYRLGLLGTSAEVFVQDASYVRLREVGLYYTFADLHTKTNNTLQSVRVGVSAYNALNFFSYRSYDPEVSNFGRNGISSGVEVNPFPTAKRYYATVTVNF